MSSRNEVEKSKLEVLMESFVFSLILGFLLVIFGLIFTILGPLIYNGLLAVYKGDKEAQRLFLLILGWCMLVLLGTGVLYWSQRRGKSQ